MDKKRYNELVLLSQRIHEYANGQLREYLEKAYAGAGAESMSEQLEDWLFVTEGERPTTASGRSFVGRKVIRNRAAAAVMPPRQLRMRKSAYQLGNAPFAQSARTALGAGAPLVSRQRAQVASAFGGQHTVLSLPLPAMLEPESQEAEIQSFEENLRKVISYAGKKQAGGETPERLQ